MDTIHPLLAPRWKVKAPWPGHSQQLHEVGDIITWNGNTEARNQKGDPVFLVDWDKYPHLFEPLPWYAERDRNSLPKYLRNTVEHMSHYGVLKNEVLKVDRYGPWDDQFIPTKFSKTYWLGYVIPATEEEYHAYIASQEAGKGGRR